MRIDAVGALDHLLQPVIAGAFERRAGDQLVALVDIGLVMQVVMEAQRLFGHAAGGEGVMRVWKIGKLESHEG